MSLSVIVCTHNPAPQALQRVLDSLAAQTLPTTQWELIVIDNASAQPLAARWALDWHPHARHVREDALGLTPARLRGLAEAKAETLAFVDDDNVLAPDYLATAAALLESHPHLGAIGCGSLAPEYEVEPSPTVLRYLSLLGRRVARPTWSNNADDLSSVPWGAGLCVTREVAQAYPQLLQRMNIDHLLDRRGDRLFGNGDVAFSWTAVMIGKGFGVFPQLQIRHLIAARRLSKAYVLRYAEDNSFSGGVSDYLRTGSLPDDDTTRGEILLRLGLRGLRRGPFATRVGLANLRGIRKARDYIETHALRPLARGLL
jgi:glycosyltransferase involved in cell wall biosynthesis